jgi:hypothetical protein
MKRLALLLLAVPMFALSQDEAPSAPPPPPPDAEDLPPPPPPPVDHRVLVPKGGGAPHAAREGSPRDSWYIGFGVGSGGGWVTDAGQRDSFKEFTYPGDRATFSFDFNIGATLTPRLLLGVEVGALGTSGSTGGYDSSIITTYFDGVVTYFPMERGFFVRGGAGSASLQTNAETPDGTFKGNWKGVNVLGGVGYAWWLGKSFNLVGQVDVTRAWYERRGPDATDTVAVTLGFEWF